MNGVSEYGMAQDIRGRRGNRRPVRLSRAFKEFEAWWESRNAIA